MLQLCQVLVVIWVTPFSHVCYCHATAVPRCRRWFWFPCSHKYICYCHATATVLAVVWVSLFSHVCYCHATAVSRCWRWFGFPCSHMYATTMLQPCQVLAVVLVSPFSHVNCMPRPGAATPPAPQPTSSSRCVMSHES